MTIPTLNLVNILRGSCSLLALTITLLIVVPLPSSGALAVPMPVPPAKIIAPPLMPAISQFAALSERPMFNPDRKPFVEKQEAEQTTAAPPQVVLLGIIADGARRLALVRAPEFPFATSVSVGRTIGGWQVSEIDAVSLVLRSGQQTDQIGLNAPAIDTGSSMPSQSLGAPQQQGPDTK